MEQPHTLYAILGVGTQASAEDIRRAFRRLARTLHPDAGATHDSGSRFRELRHAYEVLSDPVLRRRYDISLQTAQPPAKRRIPIRTIDPPASAPERRAGVCRTCGGAAVLPVVVGCPACSATGGIIELGVRTTALRICSTCRGKRAVRMLVRCPRCGGRTTRWR